MLKDLMKVNVEAKGIKELIPIYETSKGNKVVIGRELFEYLRGIEVKTKFSDWIQEKINKYGFDKDIDYTSFSQKNEKGGRPSTEYILTADTAKEIAMVENNEKGKQYRRYLIQVEKAFKKVIEKLSMEDMMIKQLEEQKKIKNRVDVVEDKLNNQMTIDHSQQRIIQRLVGKRVFERIEENKICYLKSRSIEEIAVLPFSEFEIEKKQIDSMKRRYFSSIYKEIKNRFGVPSYRDIRIKDFDLCIQYIKNWVEPQELREDK